jgi:hypothetical protein
LAPVSGGWPGAHAVWGERYCLLIEALERLGNIAEVLRLYESLRLRLREELGSGGTGIVARDRQCDRRAARRHSHRDEQMQWSRRNVHRVSDVVLRSWPQVREDSAGPVCRDRSVADVARVERADEHVDGHVKVKVTGELSGGDPELERFA